MPIKADLSLHSVGINSFSLVYQLPRKGGLGRVGGEKVGTLVKENIKNISGQLNLWVKEHHPQRRPVFTSDQDTPAARHQICPFFLCVYR